MRAISTAALMLLVFLPNGAEAAGRGFSAYDGDTFSATFRIVRIDTPEINGQCTAERELAIQARDFTRAWLAKGPVTIHSQGSDRFGRILVKVERGSEDLGDELIRAGLARAWDGRRRPWC